MRGSVGLVQVAINSIVQPAIGVVSIYYFPWVSTHGYSYLSPVGYYRGLFESRRLFWLKPSIIILLPDLKAGATGKREI
jgi:hypothetical protein